MKNTKLLALLLSAAFVAGCTGMGNQTGTQAGASQQPAAAATADASVTAKVQAALAADPDTSALKVSVDTNQGRVRLKGEVNSVAAFQKAGAVARGVPGVTSVDNQLIVCMTCK